LIIFGYVNVIGLRTVNPTDNGIDGNKSGLYYNIFLRLARKKERNKGENSALRW
jgi:hypothetical protein